MMKKFFVILLLTPLLMFSTSCSERESVSLKVLQFNVWGNGGRVDNGFDIVTGIIGQTDPDIVFLCEVRNQELIDHIKETLVQQGKRYYGNHLGSPTGYPTSTVILSKYPLDEVYSSYDSVNTAFVTELGVIAKAVLTIENQRFAVYSLHLDWKNAGPYLPRGYDGNTWAKLDSPVGDANAVLELNLRSERDEEIGILLKDMEKEVANGSLIMFGGDFNDPSHEDWQADTKDIRNHNGLVIDWTCSNLLQDAGYRDTYREIYPNAVTHPGFTFPAGNKDVDPSSLQWSEGADSRDRIDFIYYRPDERLKLIDVAIVGPKEDFYDGIFYDPTEDPIITPESGIWPSDHKATYAEFQFFID